MGVVSMAGVSKRFTIRVGALGALKSSALNTPARTTAQGQSHLRLLAVATDPIVNA